MKRLTFSNRKCILCQKDNNIPLTTTGNGRRGIIKAAEKRKDVVLKRLSILFTM